MKRMHQTSNSVSQILIFEINENTEEHKNNKKKVREKPHFGKDMNKIRNKRHIDYFLEREEAQEGNTH